jgi:hypothetical protein
MVRTRSHYYVAAKHEAFGIEGGKLMHCGIRTAKIHARMIARAAGFGWKPYIEDRGPIENNQSALVVPVNESRPRNE